jgi:hypothetical protein
MLRKWNLDRPEEEEKEKKEMQNNSGRKKVFKSSLGRG